MPSPRIRAAFLTLVAAALCIPLDGRATVVGEAEAQNVAANWATAVGSETGGWAGWPDPVVTFDGHLRSDDGLLLARVYAVAPDGFVVVTALRELPPIKLYSKTGAFNVTASRGLVQLVRERLSEQFDVFIDGYGSLEASPDRGDVFPAHHRSAWDRLGVAPAVFGEWLRGSYTTGSSGADTSGLRGGEPGPAYGTHDPRGAVPGMGGDTPELRGAGPLLTTSWHQQWPYNADCPMGDGGRCLAGCVAIGTAQVMNYHAWPDNGFGQHTYWWTGDGSVPGDSLSAVFSDDYDWSGYDEGLAEICYEVGVAYEMQYGHDASYSGLASGPHVLTSYFRYDDSISYESGSDYTSSEWFQLIQSEIGSGRPMPYGYPGHALACDGWRVWSSENQIHLNYGWGGAMNGWYAVDDIYGHSGNHTSERLIKNMFPDPAIILNAAGTGDYPAIQAAIDAADAGSTIKLQDGVYTGDGNRDVSFRGKSVTVRSQSRDPDACVVNAQGSAFHPSRGFLFLSGEGPSARLEDVCVRGGWSTEGGAGIACYASSPTVEGCLVLDNTAPYAAGVGCYEAAPTITNCTIYGNHGGGIAAIAALPQVTNTIIAANTDTFAVVCMEGGSPQLSCTNIWGNPIGDWTDCIEEQLAFRGNICADPIFCAPWDTVLTLSTPSECLPENNACGVVMGAFGEGCSDYMVYPDGSGYFPTIQSAVDAAVDGANILLVDGVFSGPGNRDVDVVGKRVNIRSVSGDPSLCTIDCSSADRARHRALTYRSNPWPASQLVGVTITGGYMPAGDAGGVLIGQSGYVYMSQCILTGNEAARGGAVAADSSAQLQLHTCEFSRNRAGEGGALWSRESTLGLTTCTLAENAAELGSGLSLTRGSLNAIQSLIAFGGPGEAVAGVAISPYFSCSDVYGNQGGDWVGCIAGQNGVDGNRTNDPRFCDAPGGDYTIAEDSPCLDLTGCIMSVGPQIGCYGIGCAQSDVPSDEETARPNLALLQNAPNPFSPSTAIEYSLPSAGHARLTVYNVTGRRVVTLVDDTMPAGRHSVVWDARDESGERVASGVYFARLECGIEQDWKRLVVLK